MGSTESKDVEPEELLLFKKVHAVSDIEIPERIENRQRTDRKYIIVFGVVLALLVPFLIYTLVYADVDRYGGYDQCGNVCGKKNTKYEQWSCTGKDFTDKRFMQMEVDDPLDEPTYTSDCVSSCSPGYKEIFSFCLKSHDSERRRDESNSVVEFHQWATAVNEYLTSVAWRVTLACFISLAIALSMLYLFRTATAAMVWSILVVVLTLLLIGVGLLWYAYTNVDSRNKSGALFLCIFFTAVLAILVIVVIFLFKKIALVIALFKEAMKATFAMPRLLLVPVVSFFAELILLVIFFTLLYHLASAGRLSEVREGYLDYVSDVVMEFSVLFTFWMCFWSAQIITGLQYMVIAGAVAKWYFARDKNDLNSPIVTSTKIAFKFHLGSVVFGSMIITIIAIIRALLSYLLKNKILKACVDTCMSAVEAFLKYLSKNAYIMTAMHGKPFYKSGKRAARILFSNVVNIVALNYIGDFILFMAHLLVVLLSLFFVYLILPDSPHQWSVYLIVAVVSLIVACVCFSIMETVIDTIFLCFCEDKLINDGMARPYAMSRGLMEFMDNSRKVFGDKKG